MDLDQLIRDVGDIAKLQRAVESHYDIEELTTGKIADRGKFKLKRKQIHGQRNAPETLNSLILAFRNEKLAPAGASELAGVGLRAGDVTALDGAERLERALDRVAELDRGYNPITGAIYGEVGLDGGHKMAHATNPNMSTNRTNMMFESQYENRTKGKREGEDLQKAIYNSLMKRLKSGEISPMDLVRSVNAKENISNIPD